MLKKNYVFLGFYERVVALKRRGVKVSIGLGGWNDSAGDKYSRLVNNRSSRKKFINNVLDFMHKYGFEGLDVDWEYPKCWQVIKYIHYYYFIFLKLFFLSIIT